MVFQDGQGCPWFHAATSLPANLQPKNVRGCTFLGEDGGSSTQKRVRLRTRSPKIDKEVNFWARMAVVPRSSEFACKLVAQECTRTYILG